MIIICNKALTVLSLLLDLETMYGVPEGLISEDMLKRRFGVEAVRAARASGLVRTYDRTRCSGPDVSGTAIGLTARGRMVAAHPGGNVHPIELGIEPYHIVSAVLYGGRL